MSSQQLGKKYERWVCDKLAAQNYQIITTNFRCHFGEIDIIAINDQTLVFIEVKARTSTKYGQPYEAVKSNKLNKIIQSGNYFREKYSHIHFPQASRIDVASVLLDSQDQVKSFQLFKNVTR